MNTQLHFHQYFTPVWVAEILYERYYRHLTRDDVVIDPTCGSGNFLLGIPSGPHAPLSYGIEIDPVLADEARRRTGRRILTGDFRTIALPTPPTALIGNPPFETTLIEQFMTRAAEILPDGGQVGFILPAYFIQNSTRTMSYTTHWSMEILTIPREIFPRLRYSLIFGRFRKDRKRTMIGLALFPEAAALRHLPSRLSRPLTPNTSSIWVAVVERALTELGGEASLTALYQLIEGRRPTANRFWQEKIRQVLQLYPTRFIRLATGYYRLAHDEDPTPPLLAYA